jgi:hypothetical protein
VRTRELGQNLLGLTINDKVRHLGLVVAPLAVLALGIFSAP